MTYDELAALLTGGSEQSYAEGWLGGEDDSGSYAIEIAGETQMVYARTESAQYECLNLGVPIAPDYPVRIYTDVNPPYVKPDDTRIGEYIAESGTSLATVGPHSHEPGQGLFDFVSTRRLRELMVVVTNPPSMSVEVLPGKYLSNAGEEVWFDGGQIDLTSYVPVTPDAWCWCKVGIGNDAALTADAGTAQSTALDLTPAQLAEIALLNAVSLAGVKLTSGMTAIDSEALFLDWRFIFQRVQSGIDAAILKSPSVSGTNKITSASDLVAFVVQAYNDAQANYPVIVQTAAGDAAFAVTARGGILVNIDGLAAPSTFSGMTLPLLYLNPLHDNLSAGHTAPHNTAILDVASTTKGVLLPRMTTSERDAIVAPATGLLIYNSTTGLWNYWTGAEWAVLDAAGGSLVSIGTKWDMDAPPGSPSASDDEFADSAVSGWTEFDPGGIQTMGESARGLWLEQTSHAGQNITGGYKTRPADSAYTIETSVSIDSLRAASAYGGIGLWQDAADTAGDLVYLWLSSANSTTACAVQFGRITAYNGTVTNAVNLSIDVMETSVRLRIRFDGTTYYADIGNGEGWSQIGTLTAATVGYTPAHMGLIANNVNTGGTMRAWFRHFRYTNSNVGLFGSVGGRRVNLYGA